MESFGVKGLNEANKMKICSNIYLPIVIFTFDSANENWFK